MDIAKFCGNLAAHIVFPSLGGVATLGFFSKANLLMAGGVGAIANTITLLIKKTFLDQLSLQPTSGILITLMFINIVSIIGLSFLGASLGLPLLSKLQTLSLAVSNTVLFIWLTGVSWALGENPPSVPKHTNCF